MPTIVPVSIQRLLVRVYAKSLLNYSGQKIGILPLRPGKRPDHVTVRTEVNEPAADLSVAVALASSFRNKPIAADVVLVGEVGLSGELRSVGQIDARLNEASKLGFKRCIIPRSLQRAVLETPPLELMAARSIAEAVDLALLA